MTLSIGDRYGRWVVVGERIPGTRNVPCRCDCGTERAVVASGLKGGTTKSCGCFNREVAAERGRGRVKHPINIGDRHGRWTVVDPSDRRAVLCRCDCGTERAVVGTNLVGGLSKSCGCLKIELAAEQGRRNRKHGLSRTKLYAVWKQAVARCTNPERFEYHYYGGRGITVHEPWLDPATFVHDVEAEIGPHQPGMTLDRINNAGNYEPGNIRWATRATQSANRGGKPEGVPVVQRFRIRRKLTAQQVQQLVEFVQSGHSYTEAAEVFPVSGTHIARVYRETAGSTPPRRRHRVI